VQPSILRKLWSAFHKWRLGENEFMFRVMDGTWIADYVAAAKEVFRDKARAERSGPGLILALLRVELWGLQIRLSQFCYGEKAKAFIGTVHARQREEERANWEAANRETAEEAEREDMERETAEQARREQRRREDERAARDPYRLALILLGLPEQFTAEDLTKAFRRAMLAAHPDAGGSTAKAQAVNAARALIKKRSGW